MTQAYNLAILANAVDTSGRLNVGTNATGTLPVANGGTGVATLTANNVLLGNGTSALQAVAPGTNGNVLTSNGTTWVSQATSNVYAGGQGQVFTSNGTFTIPTGITAVKIIVIGGGGRGGADGTYTPSGCGLPSQYNSGGGGGAGGCAIRYLTGLTPGNTLAVTIGAGGTSTSGGNSTVASGTQTVTTTTGGGGGVGGSGSPVATYAGEGGAGGTATNGTINIPGGNGNPGQVTSSIFYGSSTYNYGGNGGNSLLGSGGRTGSAGSVYGGGGGGANAGTRGNGAAGIVIFEW
jgi:hypothetical protein